MEKVDNFRKEVILWIVVAISLLLFISNFGVGGNIGDSVSGFLFGVFGLIAYLFPIALLVGSFFMVSNKGNSFAMLKLISAVLLLIFLCLFLSLLSVNEIVPKPTAAFTACKASKSGGGFLGGLLCYVLVPAFGKVGSYIIDIVVLIISVVLLSGHSAMRGMQKGGEKVYHSAKESNERYQEYREYKAKERESRRADQKVTGVSIDTEIPKQKNKDKYSDEIVELTPKEDVIDLPNINEAVQVPLTSEPEPEVSAVQDTYGATTPDPIGFTLHEQASSTDEPIRSVIPIFPGNSSYESSADFRTWEESKVQELYSNNDFHVVRGTDSARSNSDSLSHLNSYEQKDSYEEINTYDQSNPFDTNDSFDSSDYFTDEELTSTSVKKKATKLTPEELSSVTEEITINKEKSENNQKYETPDPKLLTQTENNKNSSNNDQKEHNAIGLKLEQTLQTFGVRAKVTSYSCGPAVTRYEVQPEMGVKVSKIVGLADDIKLNLAAADIRIEAPIPGKAAVGIEVPNKKNIAVPLGDLIASNEFQNSKSNLTFAVGKDIAGKVTVADIAKMPHLLIAGATGSGKSVCINSIIISILYKANPNDVKLILIDPKVVELSVYNDIPHLLIPVVTDAKKAAAALKWAVSEMTDRYQKFADVGVRDLKGYNAKIEKIGETDESEHTQKMPQIVIIVDELADLMMVASNEVEEAICRLAQLARACGIHLILATQRPSVNVITGLIKANMPSRIAFAVTSGVDSRTILDMVGAEKLLGKGDMLFYPQGIPKPLRIQGAFVSDKEVAEVVDSLKQKNGNNNYNPDVQQKIEEASTSSEQAVPILDSDSGGNDRDPYFVDAAHTIIDKDKASIGMLQRYLKVGFNRAARIMDQLEEAGVVGPEEGTKPRKVLMSPEELDQYIEESV
jgi:S-DNA-T family DNA segregation ATPase FtsK/SpoIIIE